LRADIANWRCLCWTACGSGNGADIHCRHGIVFARAARRSRGRSAALEELRERLRASIAEHPSGHLHRILKRLDPEEAARKIAPADEQKVIRAVESLCADAQAGLRSTSSGPDTAGSLARIEGRIDAAREMLNERIRDRIDAMLERGWMREVQALLDHGLSEGFEAI